MKLKASLALAFGLLSGMAYSATDLVIATVNNRQMVEMQKLSKFFEGGFKSEVQRRYDESVSAP